MAHARVADVRDQLSPARDRARDPFLGYHFIAFSMAATFLVWLFTVLLVLRVVGQLVVVLRAPRWLPPMEQWQSGLLPYPVLLFGQVIVLTLMIWISIDVTAATGYFVDPRRPEMGRAVVWFSYVYFGSMVLRYIIWMWRRPDQRWFGGTIPIIFHSFVAAFLYTFGSYHVDRLL